jgi:hypothetical protein
MIIALMVEIETGEKPYKYLTRENACMDRPVVVFYK